MTKKEQIFRLRRNSLGSFKDRGSKFLAFAYQVGNQEEIDAYVHKLKKQYYDARHHCYGYRLGETGQLEFATDDGEPSHSAGDPILGVLRSEQLTWTLVVVVRYFGGTKLGIRGLIEAYRGATEDALAHNEKEEIIAKITFAVEFAYEKTSLIKKIMHPHPVEIIHSEYTDSCKQVFTIREELFPLLQNQLTQAGFSFKLEEDLTSGSKC